MDQLLEEFLKDFRDEAILGYEFVNDSNSKLTTFMKNETLNDMFHVFLEDPAGSLIAFWKTDDGKEPIVYLNSEGSPLAVIAKDFKEFLSLLYYGSYAPLEIEQYLNYQRSKSLYEKMGEKFNEQEPVGMSSIELMEIQDRLKSEFSNFDEVISWLKRHNILPSEKPFNQIVNAYNIFPNLASYIDEQLDN